MAQCPHCHSEIKDDERFCGNCGTRIEPSEPPRPTGKETIVLPKITDLTMQPPAQPPADATIVATPQPAQPPADATIVATPQPAQPPGPPPTQALPQAGGGAYTGA